jgi:hypothetical protein
MAKAFSRNILLAWWIAADSVTVLRLAIVPSRLKLPKWRGVPSRRLAAQPSSVGDHLQKIVSMPWPCGQAPDAT